MNDLNKLSNIFYKKASLLTDMARRVMFSLIPGRRFDFIAARWAANGAINSITYGALTINEELRHYQSEIPKVGAAKITNWAHNHLGKFNINNAKTYRFFLETAIKMFDNLAGWEDQFGGKAWGDIARTVLKLIDLYASLMGAKKWSDEEEKILKQIIIYLNVLDGIMHNTGQIFEKMVEQEKYMESVEGEDPFERKDEDISRIYRMRNATELEDPIYAFREVEDLLYPKNVYKDYITQLRSTKEYYTTGDPTKKLNEITAIKNLKNDAHKYFKIKIQAEYIQNIENVIKDIDNRTNALINLLKTENANTLTPIINAQLFIWTLRHLFYFPKDQWGQTYFSIAGIIPFIDKLPKQKEINQLTEDSSTIADYFTIFNTIYTRNFSRPVLNMIAGFNVKVTPDIYKEIQNIDIKKIANEMKSLMQDSIPILKQMHENFKYIVATYE